MAKHKNKYSSDTIVSLAAIVIAIASIVVTVWQGMESRRHNRLSVRPKLEIIFESGHDSFGYVLMNNGLGPATITGKELFIDGKQMQEAGFSGYDELLEKLGMKNRKVTYTGIYPGKTIKTNERQDIFRFYRTEKDDLETLLPKIYSRVKIEIKYQSMYGEPFFCKFPN